MSDLPPLEIKALARIMNELDYYQMLHLERGASSGQVRQAYYASSRTFHPDANRHLEPETLADCTAISKRVTEGYCVLRDPRKRRAYDERLHVEGGVRMQLAEAKAAEKKGNDAARRGKTEQGRQFHQKAAAAIVRSDWAAARNNLQMALTFEPANAFFKQELEEAKSKFEAARKIE
jgi:DnaJ-class molecular chaperone